MWHKHPGPEIPVGKLHPSEVLIISNLEPELLLFAPAALCAVQSYANFEF